MRSRIQKRCFAAFCAIAFTAILPGSSRADAAGDKKRAQLLPVRRILVAPPFFGTDALGELPADSIAKPAKVADDSKKQADRNAYLEILRKLEAHSRERLIDRMSSRAPFEVIGRDQTKKAFESLKLTEQGLYQNGGRIKGKKFDLPDPASIRRLAAAAGADAVLITVIDEPRKSNGGYYFDPVNGPGYDSPKVHDKAVFDLILADGSLVFRLPVDVVHPLTRMGNRTYVDADWLETIDLLVEDLMDEMTRYTPKKND